MRVSIIVLMVATEACAGSKPDSPKVGAANVVLDSTVVQLESMKTSAPKFYEFLRASYFLSAEMGLNEMGLRSGPFRPYLDTATEAATKQYELARGLPVTGNPFARSTFGHLMADVGRLDRIRSPAIGDRRFEAISWKTGFVSAKGPWLSSDDDSTPQAINVKCFRSRMECYVAEAEYQREGLVPTIDFYDIESWDAAEIRSKPSDSICERSILTLNRVQESVSLAVSRIGKTGPCSMLEAAGIHERTSHLATSAELLAISKHQLRVIFDTLLFVSPEMRAKVLPLLDSISQDKN
jgi:hypothetical protein